MKKQDDITVLRLHPLGELRSCIASVSAGGISSVMTDFGLAAAKFIALAPLSKTMAVMAVFSGVAYGVQEMMERRALHRGQWKLHKSRRPWFFDR